LHNSKSEVSVSKLQSFKGAPNLEPKFHACTSLGKSLCDFAYRPRQRKPKYPLNLDSFQILTGMGSFRTVLNLGDSLRTKHCGFGLDLEKVWPWSQRPLALALALTPWLLVTGN